jgi:hypothetical protein
MPPLLSVITIISTEREEKGCAMIHLGPDPDRPSVPLYDPLDNGETYSGALIFLTGMPSLENPKD